MLKRSTLMTVCIIAALIGMPTLSFAKARGGSGGGFSSGSRSGNSSMSMGSRGSRTHQDNGAKPIEQSTTAKPSTAPPPTTASNPAAQSAPSSQPSFLQRNPLLTGIAAGLAGSWIGHMIFGATDSSAKTLDGESAPAPASNSIGLMLLLMMLGAGAFYLFKKTRRTPAPVLSGISRSTAVKGSLLDTSYSDTVLRPAADTFAVTTADKAAFQQVLTDVQSAWSAQDVAALRRAVTPEMLSYFSTALAEDSSSGIQNHMEAVELLQAEVLEAWSEDNTDYATAALRWSARDYTVSTTILRGAPGHLIEGSEETSSESREVWTFMRVRDGRWLLSAIQQ
ncbi:MAG: TIM44-like domain-containing protein [Nitrospira sp.]|nr:TIM44-like domain-containing protein [Nitrospira sp.]MBH0183735.1 TIM44-like domain-containing protein [Nitrospira sp.]